MLESCFEQSDVYIYLKGIETKKTIRNSFTHFIAFVIAKTNNNNNNNNNKKKKKKKNSSNNNDNVNDNNNDSDNNNDYDNDNYYNNDNDNDNYNDYDNDNDNDNDNDINNNNVFSLIANKIKLGGIHQFHQGEEVNFQETAATLFQTDSTFQQVSYYSNSNIIFAGPSMLSQYT